MVRPGRLECWRAGANFIPKDAINTIEMWDASTFNAAEIESELSLAETTGFRTMRVFLNDLVWQDDAAGFTQRLDLFLQIADRHHIKPLFVLFDSGWNAHPHLGVQPAPIAGVHNSGWVQSPGIEAVMNQAEHARLKTYVTGVIGHFANDKRILAWDLWNEPGNINGADDKTPEQKVFAVTNLLREEFGWARSANPSQPLTSGIWNGDWSTPSSLREIEKVQLTMSDVVSFHNYDAPDVYEQKVVQLERSHRPILCTEYMARPRGSTFSAILPIAKTHNVSAFNWGFVAGKTQTYFPWDSWEHPYPEMPAVWFHDVYYPDGRAYDPSEVSFLKTITH